jgi:hypothetical protein
LSKCITANIRTEFQFAIIPRIATNHFIHLDLADNFNLGYSASPFNRLQQHIESKGSKNYQAQTNSLRTSACFDFPIKTWPTFEFDI